MKAQVRKLPKSQVEVLVSVLPDEAQSFVFDIIDSYNQDIEVKGFRRGKAPKTLVVERVGLGKIQQEALSVLVRRAIGETAKEHQLYFIGSPSVAVDKFSLLPNGEVNGTIELRLTLDILPAVKLGDYTKIKVKGKKISDTDLKAGPEAVEKVLEHLRRQKSTMEEVARPAKKGDWAEISFSGKVDKVAQEKLASQNHPLVIGSGALVPGFEEELIGMEAGKAKKFRLTFAKNYFAKEFAGKPAEFEVNLHAVKKINLPAVDTEFAKGFGHSDVAALKEAIKNQLEAEKKHFLKQKLENTVLDKAKKLLKVEIPPGLLHQETDRLIKRLRENVEKQGVDFDRYLESVKKTSADLHQELEPQAKTNIEVGLILGEVMKREKLDANDKDAPKIAMKKLVEYATK